MIEIESGAEDGLLGLVTRAEHAVLEQTTDPVGVLGIELCEPPPEHPFVAVEAAFVERAGLGVVERLDVHLGLASAPSRERLLALVGTAGGNQYTSLCLRDSSRELVDVTLHYGSALRVLGRCTALAADGLRAEEVVRCREVLELLGVKCRSEGGELRVSGRRFGGPPSSAAQVDALLAARERALNAELYASTLPVTRSVRVALAEGRLRVTLSRQIPREATSIARDALALRELCERELGFVFGAQRWRVENAHGESEEHRPHGPMGDGQHVQWSLNWGARRR